MSDQRAPTDGQHGQTGRGKGGSEGRGTVGGEGGQGKGGGRGDGVVRVLADEYACMSLFHREAMGQDAGQNQQCEATPGRSERRSVPPAF